MLLLAEITTRQLLLAGAGFGLVISVWMIAVVLLAARRVEQEKAIARRLGEIDQPDDQVRVLRLWQNGQEITTIVPVQSPLRLWWARFSRFPEDAGWEMPAYAILLAVSGVTLLATVVTWVISRNPILAGCMGLAIVVVFSLYTKHRITKNTARFERQFSDALHLLARSLRAGHPLTGAFRLVAEEMSPPVSPIFARICQEQALGVDIERSLRDAAERHNSPDLKLFATSVAIQLKSGGNLADLMDRLAEVIRQRIRLSQRVRIVSAQTQLSKRILLTLPLFMLVIISLLNPAHMRPLWETSLGNKMLMLGGVLMLLGWFTMNRMAKLKY